MRAKAKARNVRGKRSARWLRARPTRAKATESETLPQEKAARPETADSTRHVPERFPFLLRFGNQAGSFQGTGFQQAQQVGLGKHRHA